MSLALGAATMSQGTPFALPGSMMVDSEDSIARSRMSPAGAAVKLSDVAYAKIFGRISGGEYAVDSRLPTENELAQLLSVSRPVVREALARLRDDGLVASRRGSGTYVLRTPEPEQTRAAPLLSIGDMRRCLEFRISFEGETAWHAARGRGDPTSLSEALAGLEEGLKADTISTESDFQFHLEIAKATGNRFFVATMSSLRESIVSGMEITRSFGLLHTREALLGVHREHLAIFDAVAAGDSDRALKSMRKHLQNAMQRAFDGVND